MIDPAGPRTVILGVAASDAHAVANHLIAIRLRMHGITVINLGVCTTLEEFADTLDRHPDAEAVVIGSLNGHAYQDLRDLPSLRRAGRLLRPVIVGGNLSIGAIKGENTRQRLLDLGVDHILGEPDALPALLDRIHATDGGGRRAAGVGRA